MSRQSKKQCFGLDRCTDTDNESTSESYEEAQHQLTEVACTPTGHHYQHGIKNRNENLVITARARSSKNSKSAPQDVLTAARPQLEGTEYELGEPGEDDCRYLVVGLAPTLN
jgi:hypothetical protein